MDQVDEFCGLRANYYVNLAAHEYIYGGRIFKTPPTASYSGYDPGMYNEEYNESHPTAILRL